MTNPSISPLSFTLVTAVAFTTVFLAGYNPMWNLWFYVLKFFTWLPFRFYSWKKDKMHYFMAEFCYLANAILLCWIFSNQLFDYHSETMFRMVYAMCSGPLPWAALTLGDKFVPHEPQRVISMLIHLTPCILMWSVRWHNPNMFPEAHMSDPSFTVSDVWNDGWMNLKLGMIPYLIWSIAYHIIIFVILDERITKHDKVTLYYHTMKRPNHIVTKTIGWIGEGYIRKIIYSFLRTLVIIPAFMTTGIWWNSFILNTAFMIMVGIGTLWQAGGYYNKKLLNSDKNS